MKKLILTITALIFALTGCAAGTAPPTGQPMSGESESEIVPPGGGDGLLSELAVPGQAEGLVPDLYDGLVMTAEVVTEGNIPPGGAFEVAVGLENTGEMTVAYVQGSGRWATPQSLFGEAEHLQYVLPRDNLGIATMDFVVKFLEPGERADFKLVFMAVEPTEGFTELTHNLFYEQNKYIADLSPDNLSEMFPELAFTAPGEYEAGAFLLYSLLTPDRTDGSDDYVDISLPESFISSAVSVTVGE